MRRRLLSISVAALAVLLLLALTLPWWFGLALRAAPGSLGLEFADYERIGYGRFALRDVEFHRRNVRVSVARVEADTPLAWLWGDAGEVVAGRWSVEVKPRPADAPAPPANRPTGWMPLRATLRRVAGQVDRWLPRARAGEGVVRWKSGELTLASARWGDRTLAVEKLAWRGRVADVTAAFPSGADEIQVAARMPDDVGSASLVSRGAAIAGEVTWWEQPAAFSAEFDEAGWLPGQAQLEAKDWNLPASRLKLGGAYARVRGQGRVAWDEGRFRAALSASSEPLADAKVPPLELDVRAGGDLQALTIEALRVVLPGVVAALSEPVTIDRRGNVRGGEARFALEADLERQPWFEARGRVTGDARVVAENVKTPVVDFRLAASDVVAQGLAIAEAEAAGRFEWPRVRVTTGVLTGAEGERLEWHGGWDFRAKEVLPASLRGEIRRETIARWLPEQPAFGRLSVRAEASGPVAGMKHAGEVRAQEIAFRGAKPAALALTWRGAGPAVENFRANVSAGSTRLNIGGAVDRDSLRLQLLELTQHDARRLRLTGPAVLRWRPVLQLEELHLAGPAGGVDASVTWGETGRVQVAVRNVASAWLSDLVELPGPPWQLNAVGLTGTWDGGPMTYSAVLGAAIEMGEGRHAVVNLAGSGDADGLRLEALRAAEGTESIVHATGALPVVLTPAGEQWMRIDRDAPLEIVAATAPNAAFWSELAALTGFTLEDPRVSANVKGTWRRPQGDVRLQAARVAVDPARFERPLPTIEDLNVALVAALDAVRLETFALRVEGQAITAGGTLPVGEADWSEVFAEPLAFARRGAELRLEIPDADLAAFARFLPDVLAPKGRLQVEASYRGGEIGGNVRLRDAATRPLGPLGVLQEIDADVRLANEALELRSVRALSGGEEVQLAGRVVLPFLDVRAGAAAAADREPRFDLTLRGNNLPFVRRMGLLVRGDLDLKLNTTERGGERITGTVRLRDSLFLQDVRSLLPSGTAGRARRPPYFSVEAEPVNSWQLDVNVVGEEFMRLRTTVFNGLASARFHLGGTLEEPIAIGEAIIEEGRIRLPFASFEVREGRVMLTREQPYEPQVWVVGESRRYGYDLRLEISGAAAAPVLAFSSSPPLEHGQVMLMVMAGEAPKEEVTYTDQQRATRLGTYLGQSLLASFGDAESANRLTISSGEKISEQGRETIEVEYELNDRWSLTGEYDEFDDYNAGVKWRVYSRGGEDGNDEKGGGR